MIAELKIGVCRNADRIGTAAAIELDAARWDRVAVREVNGQRVISEKAVELNPLIAIAIWVESPPAGIAMSQGALRPAVPTKKVRTS